MAVNLYVIYSISSKSQIKWTLQEINELPNH